MTDSAPEALRIPNVRPGALSGLDNEPLEGAGVPPEVEVTDGSELAPVLPEVPEDLTHVAELLDWVNEGMGDEDSEVDNLGRAVAVLVQEGRDGRVTLVKPLEDLLLDALVDAYVAAPDDEDPPADGAGDPDAPDPAPSVVVPDGLEGEALDEWISGDAVEGDETENPERYAAYLARVQAAYDLELTKPDEDRDPERVGRFVTLLGSATGEVVVSETAGTGEGVQENAGDGTQPIESAAAEDAANGS